MADAYKNTVGRKVVVNPAHPEPLRGKRPHIPPDMEHNPDRRKKAKPATNTQVHITIEMQQRGCKYQRFAATNPVKRAINAPNPRTWRSTHRLQSPILGSSTGRQELLPYASRRCPRPPLKTSVPNAEPRVVQARTYPQPLAPLREPLHPHSIPLQATNTHTPTTARLRATHLSAQRNRRPPNQARRFPLVPLSGCRCGCPSSLPSRFHPFIQALAQNVEFCLRLESGNMRSQLTVSGRGQWPTTSDTGIPAPFWARHVRCPVGYPSWCQHRFRREPVGCEPLLTFIGLVILSVSAHI